jgi:uncharacterized protein Yka (UPF0111/DUF47 family)
LGESSQLSGPESEVQARRRTIVVLQDEMRRVLDAARVLLDEHAAILKGDKLGIGAAMEKVKKAEEDVVMLRGALIRELSEVGTLLVNREDLLRAAFAVENIFGHVNGIAFKMSQLPKATARDNKNRESMEALLGLLIDAISKLNECIRGLSINPDQSIQLAAQVQQIESATDARYRQAVATTLKFAAGVKELIIVKDVLMALEDCADATLSAANAGTILALGL